MILCFSRNINCCWLPSHTSHGLQALDNGVFSVLKGAYEKEVEQLNSLNGSSPVGKINFTKCLIAARSAVTARTIINSFRHTGTWPINKQKALNHPEIQADQVEKAVSEASSDEEDEPPVNRSYIMGLVNADDRIARMRAKRVANSHDEKDAQIAFLERENAALQMRIKDLTKTKKRKAIPNPTARFMSIKHITDKGFTIEDLEEAGDEAPRRKRARKAALELEDEDEGEDEGEDEADSEAPEDASDHEIPAEIQTRSGRATRVPNRFRD